MLDVTRLRVIDAVARHGSVTKAAKQLHCFQPSVSHHLRVLEAETGAQLVQRVGRGIRLTEAGQLLADRAAEIIGRIDAAGAELCAHVGLTAGRVRLAGFSIRLRLTRSANPGGARRKSSPPTGHLDRHAPTRCAGLTTRWQDRRRRHLPLRRGSRPRNRTASGCTTSLTTRSTCSRPAASASWQRSATQHGSPAARALPQPPTLDLRRGGLRTANRLRLRRHGRDAGARRRRTRRDDHPRPGPTRAPRPRHHRHRTATVISSTSMPQPTASHQTRPPPQPSSRHSPTPRNSD